MGLGVLGVVNSTSGLVPVVHAPSHEGGADPVTAAGIGAEVAGAAAAAQAAANGYTDTQVAVVGGRIGAPVADVAALRAVASAGLTDKRLCLVESSEAIYSYDTAGVGADDGDGTIVPTDITPPDPGRWFKTTVASQNHESLVGLLGGAANDHQHLTTAQLAALHARYTDTEVADYLAGLGAAGQYIRINGAGGVEADSLGTAVYGAGYVTATAPVAMATGGTWYTLTDTMVSGDLSAGITHAAGVITVAAAGKYRAKYNGWIYGDAAGYFNIGFSIGDGTVDPTAKEQLNFRVGGGTSLGMLGGIKRVVTLTAGQSIRVQVMHAADAHSFGAYPGTEFSLERIGD